MRTQPVMNEPLAAYTPASVVEREPRKYGRRNGRRVNTGRGDLRTRAGRNASPGGGAS